MAGCQPVVIQVANAIEYVDGGDMCDFEPDLLGHGTCRDCRLSVASSLLLRPSPFLHS